MLLDHLLDAPADLGARDAVAGQLAVDRGNIFEFLAADLAALDQLFEHRLDMVLGIADQGDVVLGGGPQQDSSRLLEIHAKARDTFLEDPHLIVAGDQVPIERVNPNEVGKLLSVASRCRHARTHIPLLVNRHVQTRSRLSKPTRRPVSAEREASQRCDSRTRKLPLSDRRRGLLRSEIMDFNRRWPAKPVGPPPASPCLMACWQLEPAAVLSSLRDR